MSHLGIKGEYKDELFIDLSNQWRVVDKQTLQAAYNNRQHTPMSELLFRKLRRYFDQIISSDNEYERFFDEYEFINSLMHHSITKSHIASLGRFVYKDRDVVERTITDLESKGADHPWIKGGLYERVEELKPRLDSYKEYFSKKFMYR